FRLTDDPEIQALNRDFRGKDRPTNVLSFPVNERWDGALYLGDVVISAPRAMAEAKEYGCPAGDYLARLALHGLLHLMGYDHPTEADAREMEARERAILKAVGLPADTLIP
ncbi:MAG: rRNA maturation RNase YbeY, partial [bacterium]